MNDLVHYAAGLAIADALGFTGRRRWALGLFAVAPDWDVLTTPLAPYLITWLGLDHAAGHALINALGHGAFSHSLIATSAIVAIAWLAKLRGRSLLAAALAVASHYVLDFVLTWSVWPFLPFSQKGIAWGVVTTGDLVVTMVAAMIALVFLVADVAAWRARRRGMKRPPRLPAGSGLAAVAALTLVLVIPTILQAQMLQEHLPQDGAVADPVSYTRHVLILAKSDTMRLVLVEAGRGVLADVTVPRANDTTGGQGAEALAIVAKALKDADAPSPLVRPLFTARHSETSGKIVVDAIEASTVIASQHLGKDMVGFSFEFNDRGEVETIFARKGDQRTKLPLESLPVNVPIAKPS